MLPPVRGVAEEAERRMGGFRAEVRRVSLSSKVLAAWQDDGGGGDGADAPRDGLPSWLDVLKRTMARCLPCCTHQLLGGAARTAAEMRAAAKMQAVFRGHQARKQLKQLSQPSPPPRPSTAPPSLQGDSAQGSLRRLFLSDHFDEASR